MNKESGYETIIKLINFWDEYERTNDVVSFEAFGVWLSSETKKQAPKEAVKKQTRNEDLPEYLYYKNSLDKRMIFSDLISRIARYQEFYIRKFLGALPINTRLEYLFLYTIRLMGTANKTNVINLHLVDFSTGMDIIRRLVSQGFLTESVDNSDKRAKVLQITEEGEKILDEANQKINEEKNMFFSGFQENKWRKLLPVLEEINDFHNHIYLNHNEKNDAELMNLIASLKYLHK